MTLNDANTLLAVAVIGTAVANVLHRSSRRGEPLYPKARSTVPATTVAGAVSACSILVLMGVLPPGWFALGVGLFACSGNIHAQVHRHVARRAIAHGAA